MKLMTSALAPRTLLLFLGDLIAFVGALWLSLYARTLEAPTLELFYAHLVPFTLLFIVWVIVFFIAGLYESRSIILERRAISMTLLVAQLVNIITAALFFFFIPIFGIAPKTLLFIYLIISLLLVLLWRVALFPKLGLQRKERALLVGRGSEVVELYEALKVARNAPTTIVATIEPGKGSTVMDVKHAIKTHNPSFIIADFTDPEVVSAFPELYNHIAGGIRFFDALELYEEVFGRVPLSVLDERWLARNVSRYSYTYYDDVKRFIDVFIAVIGGFISLMFYPVIMLAQKLYDNGPVFYHQIRTGINNQPFLMTKFRSMSGMDQGSEMLKTKHRVTPVGKIIRMTRIDEIPQLWSVIKGDMSLIGPRPEFPAMVAEYEKEIPYYGVRHLVKPGLSGWAQLYHDNHPHHAAAVDATKEKLSYDLYYIKHRSLTLDLIIALKTVKKLFTKSGV